MNTEERKYDALRTFYVLVLGISLSKGISYLLNVYEKESILGLYRNSVDMRNLVLVLFIAIIARFLLVGLRHMDLVQIELREKKIIDRPPILIIDFMNLIGQGVVLVSVSHYLSDLVTFYMLLLMVLMFDSFWSGYLIWLSKDGEDELNIIKFEYLKIIFNILIFASVIVSSVLYLGFLLFSFDSFILISAWAIILLIAIEFYFLSGFIFPNIN